MEEAKLRLRLRNPYRWFKCRCQRYYKLKDLIRHRISSDMNSCRFVNGQSGCNGVKVSNGPQLNPANSNDESSQGQDEVPFSQLPTQVVGVKVEAENSAPAASQVLRIVEFEAAQDLDANISLKLKPSGTDADEAKADSTTFPKDDVADEEKLAMGTLIEENSKQDECVVPKSNCLENRNRGSDLVDEALATVNYDTDPKVPGLVELVEPPLLDIHQLPTQILPVQTDLPSQNEDGHDESSLETFSHLKVSSPSAAVSSQSSQSDNRIFRRSQRIQNQKIYLQQSLCGITKLKKLPYKCNFCTIRFKKLECRFLHEQKCHSALCELDADFQMCRCQACPHRLFKTKWALRRHFQKRHCVLEVLLQDDNQPD